MAGVTAEGFVRPTVQELKEQFEQDQLAEISPSLDLSSDSLLGQLNGIYARHLGIAWEALETCYHGFDPDAAEDALLTALSKLTGTERRPASASRVTCTIDLDSGATLVSGDHFAHVANKPDVRFTPEEDFTAPNSGTHSVVFMSEELGPVAAPAGQLTVIATPVVGWNSITNENGATLGRLIDTDPELRVRREAQLTRAGSSTLDAIRADLLELDGIQSVVPLENTTSSVVNSLPPHSFEMVIWDNDPSEADNDEIAQVIWDNKPSGVLSGGVESGTAIDSRGNEQTVNFSRATKRDVYLVFEVEPRDGYVGSTLFKSTLAQACNELFGVNDSVAHYDIMMQTTALGAKVVSLKLGFSVSPTLSNDLTIAQRQIARFDTSRITVTEV